MPVMLLAVEVDVLVAVDVFVEEPDVFWLTQLAVVVAVARAVVVCVVAPAMEFPVWVEVVELEPLNEEDPVAVMVVPASTAVAWWPSVPSLLPVDEPLRLYEPVSALAVLVVVAVLVAVVVEEPAVFWLLQLAVVVVVAVPVTVVVATPMMELPVWTELAALEPLDEKLAIALMVEPASTTVLRLCPAAIMVVAAVPVRV